MSVRADTMPHDGRDAALSEAALQLLTAAPDDGGLRRVRDLLQPFTADPAEPDWVRQALATGVELLDHALTDSSAQDSAVARVGVLIELIMHGGDDSASAAEPAEFTLAPEVVQELFPDFLAECFDYLEQVEGALLHLRSDGIDTDAVNLVFRAFHTIKSTSAVLGLQSISALAHSAESVLSELRDAGSVVNTTHADFILACTDMVRALLAAAERTLDGSALVLPAGYDALMQRLRLAEAEGIDAACASPQRANVPLDDAAPVHAQRVEQRTDQTMRVRTERLDHLVDLIGELVVAQSMTAQDPLVLQDRHGALARKVAHSGKIVRELQQLGMSLRMVPLRPLFQRMERVVRDVAAASGKHVEFVTAGEDTEIDRNMVDFLADPLVHMIRNAVDHGLELPEQRSRAGKPPHGTLRVAAWHAAGDVMVELQDDGRGLDLERIRTRAVERGLIEADRVLSNSETCSLIFAPGLSTADAVSALSGRGVGMDVVRRNIEALRGRIEITSVPGAGTSFTLRLPLTLAITEGMLVRVGGDRYIVPTADIHMSFRPAPDALTVVAGMGELVMLHGALLPVIRLHALFGAGDAQALPEQGVLVVVGSGSERYALLVDELLGQQQFVARPVSERLGAVPGIAGAAILGDGCVGLILDIAGVIAAR